MTDISKYVAKYLELRDRKAAMEAEHKERVAPLSDALEKLENFFGAQMSALNVNSLPTDYGTPYKSTLLQVKATNKPKFVAFAMEHKDWDLLDIRPSKSGIEVFLEKNRDVIIPGIELTQRINVNVRKK
jgi:hypothetical protein